MDATRGPRRWLGLCPSPWLLLGLVVPVIGIAAAIGLVVYFVGAVWTVVRARWYSHVPFPTVMLLLAVAAFAFRMHARNTR